MNQMSTAKLILAIAGIGVFLVGVRTGMDLVRFTGIALVASAWLLRFTARSRSERALRAAGDVVAALHVTGTGPSAEPHAEPERDRRAARDQGDQPGDR